MLEGKVVVITGAAAGIGRGLAMAVASAGAAVVVTARRIEAAEEVAADIRARSGRAIAVRCDVSIRSDVEDMIATTLAEYGRLDAIVHNAVSRQSQAGGLIRDVTRESWDEQVGVALRGAYYCGRAGFAALRESRGSYIILSSGGGIEGSRDRPVYSALKGAQRALVKSLSQEWGPYGIRVNTISPTAMTPTMAEVFETQPALRKYIVEGISLRRVGDPERDVGAVLNFLIGPGSSFVTGQTMMVDGGRTLL